MNTWRINGDIIIVSPLAAPSYNVVSHSLDRSKPFVLEILVSYSHLLLYYINSVLMFYFILFHVSIKCANKEELCTNI